MANYARPPVQLNPAEARAAWTHARQVFESRCVVCHGCYDAPCQLKVYDGARLLAATPTRLEVDAHDTQGWRMNAFHPVLPEGAEADPRASLLCKHPSMTSCSADGRFATRGG